MPYKNSGTTKCPNVNVNLNVANGLINGPVNANANANPNVNTIELPRNCYVPS